MVDADAANEHRRDKRSFKEAYLLGGVGVLMVALCLWWVNLPRTHDQSLIPAAVRAASGREVSGPYIGSRVCGECHPGEFALYTGSGHARTLRQAARLPLARSLNGRTIADPERPGVTWSYALRDGDFRLERKEAGSIEQFIVDYAFGSGHHATSFVTLTDLAAPTALEHRITHYAATDSLGLTPGQRAARPTSGTTLRGREQSPEETLKCFRCHSTRISAGGDRLDINVLIPNVSCERCHGPGRAHVAAARSGQEDLTMPFGYDNVTAESQLGLCGQCHRHPSRSVPGVIRPENAELARFQPVGISQSRCYTQSAGAFRCVTCHDPHARASSNRPSYEPACLKCHEPDRNSACPVSPRSGCIDCHMPKVDSGQHILFTDHWIRVRERLPPSPDR